MNSGPKPSRDPETKAEGIAGYLEAWERVDSPGAVPFAVAKKAFGTDPKPFIEELNAALIA